MAMMTSAYANKVLKKVNDDKEFWRRKEAEGHTYVAALDEEPVIPLFIYDVMFIVSEGGIIGI